uniref:Uncharacterized protein n=1 Tax=Anguilla anguilla TaxID=7936 RepID=A0A0E9UE98_ANGAN
MKLLAQNGSRVITQVCTSLYWWLS